MDYIALSVPVFFLLIGLELLYGVVRKVQLYRLNDAITNLSCGMGQQVLGAYFKILSFWLYVWIFENARIYTFLDTWYTWLLLFLGVDFAYYWFHRLSHEINAIWATHIVHHQSEDYNLSVALRQSWFQTVFSSWFYVPLAFLGFSPLMIVTVVAFNTLYQFWIHTKAIHKMPRLVEWIFNTPSHHRVHHGTNPLYIDRNHAGSLIIWDRMFGTFQEEQEEVVYGITTPLRSWDPVWANFHYWVELGKKAGQTRHWPDKIKIFMKPPGWHPADLGGFQPPPPVNPAQAVKFDVPVSRAVNLYVFLQFVLITGVTSFYMFSADPVFANGLNTKDALFFTVLAMFILLSLFSFGQIFGQKKGYRVYEMLRLLSLPLLVLFYTDHAYFIYLLTAISITALLSVIHFILIRS